MNTNSEITTVDINTTKTIAIHFGDTHNADTRQTPDDVPQYTQARQGKYLGFIPGPEAVDTSWVAPTQQIQQQLKQWNWSKMGLHLSIAIYSIFVLPILTFVAQLQHPSRATLLAESKANTKIAMVQHGRPPTL